MDDEQNIQTPEASDSQQLPPEVTPPVQKPIPGKKQVKWLIVGLVLLFLSSSVVSGYYVYQNYQLKRQPNSMPTPAPILTLSPTPLSQQQEYCELDKEYKNTATNPLTCKCPYGYTLEVIDRYWGPCPQPGMRDCPASIVHCIEQSEITPDICNQDGDCGLNICDCKADIKDNIKPEDKICTRYCPGTVKCINNQCQLIE